jgi:hypothetical protein
MANGRCRMHGGKSTGAPKGNNNAYVYGLRKTAAALRKAINAKIDFALIMGRGMVRTEKTGALHRTINEPGRRRPDDEPRSSIAGRTARPVGPALPPRCVSGRALNIHTCSPIHPRRVPPCK